MTDENKKTLEAYENGLAEYNAAAIPEVVGSVKDWVDTTLTMLPRDARILELGSAHGRDSDYIESKGFTVERTDAAHSFVTYLQEHGHEARILDALTNEFGGPFDMVFANAVLLHFTPQQLTQVLENVSESLVDNGLLSFSLKIGEGSEWSDAKLVMPRFFTYWNETELRNVVEAAKFEVTYWEEGQTGHTNGNWYHVIARKLVSKT